MLRCARRRRERGAVAVEFALVLPILVVLVFGIIDYGFYFNNAVENRQAVREAARVGVVSESPSDGGCDTMACIAARVVSGTTPLAGTSYGRAFVKGGADWARGETLVVCGVVDNQGVTGLTPLPSSGVVRSTVEMRIEQPEAASSRAAAQTGVPPGGWGGWCD